MIAAGLDIGGTKIEVQVFDAHWKQVARQRVATPDTYAGLLAAVVEQVEWAHDTAGAAIPVGIGAAGAVHPKTGRVLAGNLAASGHAFPSDIERAIGGSVTFMNDSRAMALSEAVWGAGRGHDTVVSVILGTGIGGGIVTEGQMRGGASGLGGEFGHFAAAASVVAEYGLPIWDCGCGRKGCVETYLAGAGLERLALHVTGKSMDTRSIAAQRQGDMAQVWEIWCALAGEFMHTLTLVADPDVIVVGGGLSQIDGIADDLSRAAQAVQLGEFDVPPIVVASAGDTSGARGAAYAAWQEAAT